MNKDMNPSYITEHQTERCVLCGKDTNIPIHLPIDYRKGYVEGAGQLCESCQDKI